MTTLADIFRRHGATYQQQFEAHLLPSHRQAMRAIVNCRTEALGGHVAQCPDCGFQAYYYHSCRNRHCPQCQADKGRQWLVKQQELLLPVPYFMLTFTLPAELRPLTRTHQRLVYNLLFRASSTAMQQLAQDERLVGGQLGMMGILHTWGRNLSYHPHVHYLVPALALTSDREVRFLKHNFLLPVKPLAVLFRAQMRDGLRTVGLDEQLPHEMWHKDWVVHCQPVGSGLAAVKYLAPYVFRVALTNRRILKLSDTHVTFQYRATETGKWRRSTVTITEFMRRFLQHVLPKGFVKVRYFGWLSAGQRSVWQLIRLLLPPHTAENVAPAASSPLSRGQPICPHCHQPLLLFPLRPSIRAPPVSAPSLS